MQNTLHFSSKGSKLLSEGQLLIQCASWPSFPNTWHHFCIFQLKLDSPPPQSSSYLSKALGNHQYGVLLDQVWKKLKVWSHLCTDNCRALTTPLPPLHIFTHNKAQPKMACQSLYTPRSMTDLMVRGQIQTSAEPPRSPECHSLLWQRPRSPLQDPK